VQSDNKLGQTGDLPAASKLGQTADPRAVIKFGQTAYLHLNTNLSKYKKE
jgi:hypothetical protein